MGPVTFIDTLPPERQQLMRDIHAIILANDPTVQPVVGTMMRSEMILYNDCGTMKYGLASVKNHMSLHCLPIYGVPALHQKYTEILPAASFQKGCINFKNSDEMPLDILAQFITECSQISMKALMDQWKKKK
jgi:Domain of unknown function (DU1801)